MKNNTCRPVEAHVHSASFHLAVLVFALSPSGCTFWGKKPWSRKKKILWQLGTLVGAPVGIALIAGIAIPAIIIGIPVYVGRKVCTSFNYLLSVLDVPVFCREFLMVEVPSLGLSGWQSGIFPFLPSLGP